MFYRSSGPLQLNVDLHSHLIPGVDDGVKSIEESISLIQHFLRLGYKKLILTPHISENYYPNSQESLSNSFNELQSELEKRNIQIKLQLGAEYMVDGSFLHELKSKSKLLSWNGFLLIETGFQTKPLFLDEAIFEIRSQNLTPVLAHPERYSYYYGKVDKLKELRQQGVKMQITAGSLSGYYGSDSKKMAQKLLNQNSVDFIGSDVHGQRHISFLEKGLNDKLLRKQSSQAFLNDSLL